MIIIILIWYPKCSTCKKAKQYLEKNNLSFETRDIVLETPSKDELRKYVSLSGKDTRKFFNTSGMKYRELGLKDKLSNMSEDDMISLLSGNGMLIKRPILVTDNKVLLGFKEKEWSELK